MLPKLGCLLRVPHREDTNPLRDYRKGSLGTALIASRRAAAQLRQPHQYGEP